MNATYRWKHWLKALMQPSPSPELSTVLAEHQQNLPVIWLLGKTGSGKTSIVQRLTKNSKAEIGSGFAPCTSTAMQYDFPKDTPIVRFLDTRGLGEANYDPTQDLAEAQSGSHALVVLVRVDDIDQSALLSALGSLSNRRNLPVVLVHTHKNSLEAPDRTRAIKHHQSQIAECLGWAPQSVEIDFPNTGTQVEQHEGIDALCDAIITVLPELSLSFSKHEFKSSEQGLYELHKREIIGFASTTAAADVVPAFGLVAVPTIQGKMMHTLAGRYGVPWDKGNALAFISALGSTFLYRYFIYFTGRQLSKFIPVYGQTAGAAAAASISFASTYALGRALCMYLYHQKFSLEIDQEKLKTAFQQAYRQKRLS